MAAPYHTHTYPTHTSIYIRYLPIAGLCYVTTTNHPHNIRHLPMAINQERMLALIAAGEAWQQAWEEAIEMTISAVHYARSGDWTTEEALQSFANIEKQTAPRPQAILALGIEARHFESFGKKNKDALMRARGARRMTGARVNVQRVGAGLARQDEVSVDDIARMIKRSEPPEIIPTRADYEKLDRTLAAARLETLKTLPATATSHKNDYTPEQWKRIVEKNPGLETVNEPPAPINLEDL